MTSLMCSSNEYGYGDGTGRCSGNNINALTNKSSRNIGLLHLMYRYRICLCRGVFNINNIDQIVLPGVPLLRYIILELNIEKCHD